MSTLTKKGSLNPLQETYGPPIGSNKNGTRSAPTPHLENGFRQPHHIMNLSLGTILLVVLVLLLIGAIPAWPFSRSWGYFPSGVLAMLLAILIILVLAGKL